MARRRYLMAYDIADPKRLRRICTLMEDHGERLQYSVFLCDLTVAELAELESAVTEVMYLHEDSVVQIDNRPSDRVMWCASGPVPRRNPVSARKQVSDHLAVFSRRRPQCRMPPCWHRSHDPVSCLLTGQFFSEP